MRASFTALFMCFCIACVSGQSAMIKAYVVTEKGDTLKGEAKINPKKEIDHYTKVNFKDESGVQKMYKPNKIKAYGFNNENFVAMDSEDGRSFYKVLAAGSVNFYKLGFESMRMNEVVFQEEYYISNSDDKELILVKESKFKKQIGELMKDNPELVSAYGDDKKLNCEKAIEIITNYNSWKAGK